MIGCDGCGLDELDLPDHIDPATLFASTPAGTLCHDCTRHADACRCYDATSMEYGDPCGAVRCRQR